MVCALAKRFRVLMNFGLLVLRGCHRILGVATSSKLPAQIIMQIPDTVYPCIKVIFLIYVLDQQMHIGKICLNSIY